MKNNGKITIYIANYNNKYSLINFNWLKIEDKLLNFLKSLKFKHPEEEFKQKIMGKEVIYILNFY